MKTKYLLIDCNNLLYRAHYATDLTDSKGRKVSGAIGVMKMTGVLIRKFKPEQVIVAWDEGKSQERLALYPEYKSKREEKRKPGDRKAIERQKKICQDLFNLVPVRQVVVNGVEADDIIGILCEKLKGKKIVVSNDQDFIQLVNKDTNHWLPNKKLMLTKKTVGKFLGFPVKHYILWKSMVGDTSDSIKGLNGIGPVKATNIIVNGLGKEKKPPITSEQQEILTRNKYLISIGALLQPEQLKAIKILFKKEKGKIFQRKKIQNQFGKLGFRQLYLNFGDWERPFKKL